LVRGVRRGLAPRGRRSGTYGRPRRIHALLDRAWKKCAAPTRGGEQAGEDQGAAAARNPAEAVRPKSPERGAESVLETRMSPSRRTSLGRRGDVVESTVPGRGQTNRIRETPTENTDDGRDAT